LAYWLAWLPGLENKSFANRWKLMNDGELIAFMQAIALFFRLLQQIIVNHALYQRSAHDILPEFRLLNVRRQVRF
jgi:hypothetical protein